MSNKRQTEVELSPQAQSLATELIWHIKPFAKQFSLTLQKRYNYVNAFLVETDQSDSERLEPVENCSSEDINGLLEQAERIKRTIKLTREINAETNRRLLRLELQDGADSSQANNPRPAP